MTRLLVVFGLRRVVQVGTQRWVDHRHSVGLAGV